MHTYNFGGTLIQFFLIKILFAVNVAKVQCDKVSGVLIVSVFTTCVHIACVLILARYVLHNVQFGLTLTCYVRQLLTKFV